MDERKESASAVDSSSGVEGWMKTEAQVNAFSRGEGALLEALVAA